MNNLLQNLITHTIGNTRHRVNQQDIVRRENAIADNNMRELIQDTIARVRLNRKKRQIHEINKLNKRKGYVLTQDNIKNIFDFI